MLRHRVYASVPIFFDSSGKIDWSSIEKYFDMLLKSGVAGIYSMAFNTRYMQLDFSEICSINKLAIEYFRGWSGDVIVGTPYLAYDNLLDSYFDFFEKHGLKPTAISYLFPERAYANDHLVDWHLSKKKYGHPICIHEMKLVSGYSGQLEDWDKDCLDEILSSPFVWGIKEDSKNDDISLNTITKFHETKTIIVAGHGKRRVLDLAESTPHPITWLNGSSMILPALGQRFADALSIGDKDFCLAYLGEFELPFFKIVNDLGWHRASKSVICHFMGIQNFERAPLSFISVDQLRKQFPLELAKMQSFVDKFE